MKSSPHLLSGLLGASIALIGTAIVGQRGSQIREYVLSALNMPGADKEVDIPLGPITTSSSACREGTYTIELLSMDPLIIYINDFLDADERAELIKVGDNLWSESTVADDPTVERYQHPGRTSTSAFLPMSAPIVNCVLERARRFLGFYHFDEIEAPQLTRYQPGQQYEAHFDWPPTPWRETAHGNMRFDRFSTFFVYLEANCTGGSTHFPRVDTKDLPLHHRRALNTTGSLANKKYESVTVEPQDGFTNTESLAVKPIAGNAVFWVNMEGEAQGHPKTKHAGMPVHEGTKIGLNIWPRRYLAD